MIASLFGSLLSFVLLYRYVALFAIVYSAAVLIPFPVDATLLAVGAFASQHFFSFWLALTVAVVANVLGDLTDYGIARRYGERVIRALKLDKNRFFVYVRDELRRDAAITVFVTRFAGVVSVIGNFSSGLVGVPFSTFLLWDFVGNFIEPFAALSCGYLVGDYWSNFSGIFGLVAAIVGVGIVMFLLIRIYQRILRRYSSHD